MTKRQILLDIEGAKRLGGVLTSVLKDNPFLTQKSKRILRGAIANNTANRVQLENMLR